MTEIITILGFLFCVGFFIKSFLCCERCSKPTLKAINRSDTGGIWRYCLKCYYDIYGDDRLYREEIKKKSKYEFINNR